MSQILIIEDDPYVRKFYDRLFKLNNYDVVLAATSATGLELAKSLVPKLIFLDIVMPDINGLEVLQRLKSDPVTSHIPIIVLTNLNDPHIIQQAAENKADGFLVKSDTSESQLISEAKKYA